MRSEDKDTIYSLYLQPNNRQKKMKTPARIITALLIALLATNCCPCRSYQKKTRRPLVGTTWQLVQLNGQRMQPEKGRFTVRFSAEEGRVSGIGACNQLSGNYKTDEKRTLEFGPTISTRRACPKMAQEAAFLRALATTTHYDMDGPMLLLLGDGELKAILQAVSTPDEK